MRDWVIRAVPALARAWWAIGLAALLIGGCAPSPGRPSAGGNHAATSSGPKTITLAVLAPIKVYGHMEYPAGGASSLTEIHSAGLVTNGRSGGLEGRLASTLPSFDAGSMQTLPDGRVQNTWKLRSDVRWHDGARFGADDVILGWKARLAVPGPEANRAVSQIETMEAPDQFTLVMTYRKPYFHALDLTLKDLWPYPTHRLAEPFAGDQDAFINHAYWTTEYVHLGPFRVVDFGLGEQQVFERFDDYFLGRPKADRIVIRSIPDTDVVLANLRAGAIDIAPEKTLFTELILQLRDEWKQSGAGTVHMRPENWRYAFAQLNTDWSQPPELGRDPRIRRGMYRGLDRVSLREWALPGIPDTDADSFMPKNDPRAAAVGQPFGRYPYDPAQALKELAEAGWTRAADGRMLNRNGEQVQITLRGSVLDTKEVSVITDYWRQLGIDMVEQVYSPTLAQDREYRAKTPGLEIQSRGSGDEVLDNLYSTNRPLPENRYVGSNPSGYTNPAFDRLYDQLTSTIDEHQQGAIMREMGEILATDMPVLPTYFRVQMAVVPAGVRALDDYAGTTLARGSARNSHLWDKD